MSESKTGVQISTPILTFGFAVLLQIVSLVWFGATQNAKIEQVAEKVQKIEGDFKETGAVISTMKERITQEPNRILEESRMADNVALSERRALEKRITELEAVLKATRQEGYDKRD